MVYINYLIDIFPNNKKIRRGSSANWKNDGLTLAEKEEYKRDIEIERELVL